MVAMASNLPKLGFCLGVYGNNCLPPRFDKCKNRSLTIFLYFVKAMWPNGVQWITYPEEKRGEPGINQSGTLYGDLLTGEILSDASSYGITERSLANYYVSTP